MIDYEEKKKFDKKVMWLKIFCYFFMSTMCLFNHFQEAQIFSLIACCIYILELKKEVNDLTFKVIELNQNIRLILSELKHRRFNEYK